MMALIQRSKYVFLILVLLAAGSVLWGIKFFDDLRKNNPTIDALSGADASINTTSVQFTIGETVLKIPRNYFSNLPERSQYYGEDLKLHDGPDKNQINFGMHLLLPNYEPRTAENSMSFDRPPLGDSILLLVISDSPSATGKKMFENFYKFKTTDITDGPSGFEQFRTTPSTYGMFQGTIENPKNFVLCSGVGVTPYPSCNRYIRIAPQTVMQYTFPIKYLPEISVMDNRLIDMLNGFKVSGPSFSLID